MPPFLTPDADIRPTTDRTPALDPKPPHATAAPGHATYDAAPRCRDTNVDWTTVFFSDDVYDIARAKHLCRPCPVRETCLLGALERREPCGVWGGELLQNGQILAEKRGRGRPPKTRPAEVILIDGDEVVVVGAY